MFTYVFFVLLACSCINKTFQKRPQYDELYASGIRFYLDGDYELCVKDLEESIKLYHYYNHALKECSELCDDETAGLNDFVINKAICDQKCDEQIFKHTLSTVRMDVEVDKAFKNRKPYSFLQYAYFKLGKVRKAVEAAYTYLEYDPDDPPMNDNMEYYKSRADFQEDMLIDLELLPMMDAYKKGSQAYIQGDYEKSIELLTIAVDEFYKEEGLCRMRCDRSFDVGAAYSDDTQRSHQVINEHFRQLLECNLMCVNEIAATSSKFALINFLPELYNYLQFAHFQVGDLKEAHRCARSYLVLLPNDSTMLKNLDYYVVKEKVQPHQEVVRLKRRIDLQVELLRFYYQSFGIKDHDIETYVPYKSTSERAKQERKNSADVLQGPRGDDDRVLTSQEELKEVEAAPEVVQLRETTDDELAPPTDANPNFADGKLGGYKTWQEKTDDIINSRDISNIRRESLERKKRENLEDEEADDKVESEEVEIKESTQEDLKKRLEELNKSIDINTIGRRIIDSPGKIRISDSSSVSEKPITEGPIPQAYTLLANSSQMGGPSRFALDGLASDHQCRTLIDLEMIGGRFGDGYYGNENPHTAHERFHGLTLYEAIKQAENGDLPVAPVRLFDEISQQALQITKSYFKLDKELYFDYTHLVCRTAAKKQETAEGSRTDLSHPVHGDNCQLQVDGSCVKESPAYTWRDYSAIVYLNDDFEGGEFIMTESTARQVTLEVTPKCGRLVSFCAGAECLHGVKPVKRGRRCAVALWFTHDPTHDERRNIRTQLPNAEYFKTSTFEAANKDEL